MKMFRTIFVFTLIALAFAGCSTCKHCKKQAVAETPAAVIPQAEAAPAAEAVQEAAPAAPAEESVPAATRKYVNK